MRRTLVTLAGLSLLGLVARAADPLGEPRPLAAARVVNADEVRRNIALLPNYATNPNLKNVKIAVLDSGFDGVDGKRPYLPANTVVVEHYDKDFIRKFDLGDPEFVKPFTPGNPHGRQMAQLVWAMAGNSPDGPQFFLLNANGPTMFRRAVRFAVELKVDVVLFSGMFEGGGNYDGTGPINVAVDDAVVAGIIWVNAAGNYGSMVYNGPVEVGPAGFLQFGQQPGLRFTNRLDENAVTVTLTWNDYREQEDFGTDKDLDLVVEDAAGRVVGEGKLTQVPPGKAAGEGETKNPRERVTIADLPAVPADQPYRIRIRAKAGNFGPRDRVRVLLTPAKGTPYPDPATGKLVYPVEFLDASKGGEVYPPADHPGVLTVGDGSRFSSVGPTADGRVKPDVVMPFSLARFSNGEESAGSSNAAAYFAGAVVAMRAREPGLTTAHVREWVRRLDALNRQAPRPEAGGQIPAAPPPAPLPSAFPPGLPIPASPNQQRAMKYVENAMEDQRVRGQGLQVWISTPRGSLLIQRPPRAAAPPPPVIGRPAPPNGNGGIPPANGAAGQIAPPPAVTANRPPPPHAAWTTPSPAALTELVHGRR